MDWSVVALFANHTPLAWVANSTLHSQEINGIGIGTSTWCLLDSIHDAHCHGIYVARMHADADRFLGYKDKSRKSGTCMNTYLGQMDQFVGILG